VRVFLGDFGGETGPRAARIHQGGIFGEVEAGSELLVALGLHGGHGVHKVLEHLGVLVDFAEGADSVGVILEMGQSGLERGLESAPHAVKANVEHLHNAADIAALLPVEEMVGVGSVAIDRALEKALAREEAQSDHHVQVVAELPHGAFEIQSHSDLLHTHLLVLRQKGEQPQTHRRQQDLRRPERESHVEYGLSVQLTPTASH